MPGKISALRKSTLKKLAQILLQLQSNTTGICKQQR
jgi:hypothetical protein